MEDRAGQTIEDHLRRFEKENPELFHAMRVLNLSMESYLRALTALRVPATSATSTTSPPSE